MRWESLFADLEAQLAAEDRAEFEAEVADRTRSERGAVELAQRLRAQGGQTLVCHLSDGEVLRGVVEDAGLDWLLLRLPEGTVVLPHAAVVVFEGLAPGVVAADGPLARRLSLGVLLRGLSRDRQMVVLQVRGGRRVAGVIDRVGRDHLDVTPRDDLATRPTGAPMTVPYAAVLKLIVR